MWCMQEERNDASYFSYYNGYNVPIDQLQNVMGVCLQWYRKLQKHLNKKCNIVHIFNILSIICLAFAHFWLSKNQVCGGVGQILLNCCWIRVDSKYSCLIKLKFLLSSLLSRITSSWAKSRKRTFGIIVAFVQAKCPRPFKILH